MKSEVSASPVGAGAGDTLKNPGGRWAPMFYAEHQTYGPYINHNQMTRYHRAACVSGGELVVAAKTPQSGECLQWRYYNDGVCITEEKST